MRRGCLLNRYFVYLPILSGGAGWFGARGRSINVCLLRKRWYLVVDCKDEFAISNIYFCGHGMPCPYIVLLYNLPSSSNFLLFFLTRILNSP